MERYGWLESYVDPMFHQAIKLPAATPPATCWYHFLLFYSSYSGYSIYRAISTQLYGVRCIATNDSRVLQVWAAVIARWILNFLSSTLKIFLEVDRICDEPTTSLHSVVINVRLRNEDWLFSLFCRLLESKPNNNSPAMRNFTAILSITEARLFPILEIATS